jgi:hypothetical protein
VTEHPPASEPGDAQASRLDRSQYPPPPYQPYGQPQYDQLQYNQPQDDRSGSAAYGQPPPMDWYSFAPSYSAPSGRPYGQLSGNRRLDGWSVAGLIFGILPTVVLGAVFSIIGLIRTRVRQRRGRTLAVTGLVLSMVWLVGLVAFGVRNADQQQSAAHENVDPLTLQLGDCFQQVPSADPIAVATVPKVPCDKPHNAVIFAIVEPADATYPGRSVLSEQAVALCGRQAVGYLGRSLSQLRTAAFVPPAASWQLGRKSASCVLYDPSRNFTGDIREDR